MGRTAIRWLLALGFLGSLSAQAASPVWAIKGEHNTVYLAGSVHVLPVNDTKLPKAFDHAYADSARLVMEIDLAKLDPIEAGEWMSEQATLPVGKHLHEIVGDRTYARVVAAAAVSNLPMMALDHQAPWMVGIELSEHAYDRAGYDGADGVDEQLAGRAQADHRPTAGLETLQEQLSGLIALSPQDQTRMLDESLDELDEVPSEMRDIMTAWRAGNAPRLATLLSTEYDAFPALYGPLVTVRNEHWLPQIRQMLKEQDNVLVVVGALHLVGKGGLLESLRHEGYTVTQLN